MNRIFDCVNGLRNYPEENQFFTFAQQATVQFFILYDTMYFYIRPWGLFCFLFANVAKRLTYN